MTGKPIRQDYLEAVIKWISNNSIQDYMGIHQHDKDAKELWEYFQAVVNWVELVFYTKRPIMKGVEWGLFYNKYKDQSFDSDKIEQEIKELILDDDVQKKSSIYEYILTRDEKCLNIRAFSPAQKLKAYELQAGICNICKEKFEQNKMEADHITPWADGGRTIQENCQMLCRDCNLYKSDK